MRAVIQRVSRASVRVAGGTVGAVGAGLLVFVGVAPEDDGEDASLLAAKIRELRIFEDVQGRMNLALNDTGGAVLVVPQFTLFADCGKGRRPYFGLAAPPERARTLYLALVALLERSGLVVATGSFGAAMEVELVNDGPVTILLDTAELRRREKS